MMGFGMGFGGIGMILMLLFWGGLIFGGAWLVKALFNGGQSNPGGPAALRQTSVSEILDQRYARGEITREQYELMEQDLL